LIGSGGFNDVLKIPDKNIVLRLSRLQATGLSQKDKKSVQDEDKQRAESEILGLYAQALLSNCENICDVYDFGYYEPYEPPQSTIKSYTGAYSVLEYLPYSLDQFMITDNKTISKDAVYENVFKLQNIVDIFKNIMNALICMHEKNFAHLDLKQANVCIYIDDNNKPIAKLVDFGSVHYFKDKDSISYHDVERTQHFCDNFRMITKKVSIKSDIYALGILMAQTFFHIPDKYYIHNEEETYIHLNIEAVQTDMETDIPAKPKFMYSSNSNVDNTDKIKQLIHFIKEKLLYEGTTAVTTLDEYVKMSQKENPVISDNNYKNILQKRYSAEQALKEFEIITKELLQHFKEDQLPKEHSDNTVLNSLINNQPSVKPPSDSEQNNDSQNNIPGGKHRRNKKAKTNKKHKNKNRLTRRR